jgi:hypothetical protein
MEDKVKDGGPAFPSVGEGFNNPLYSAPGMSLRDWFAGQVMTGICANAAWNENGWAARARAAYDAADAILSARQQKDDTQICERPEGLKEE